MFYYKTTANIIVNSEKLKAFLLRSGTEQGCLILAFPFNTVLEVLARAIRQEKKKGHPNQRGKSRLSCFADDMILYIENIKDSTKTLLELINDFTKFVGYKINIEKSIVFPYIKMI